METDSSKFETARNTIYHHDSSMGIRAVLAENLAKPIVLYARLQMRPAVA
jgi:hypothetical protein